MTTGEEDLDVTATVIVAAWVVVVVVVVVVQGTATAMEMDMVRHKGLEEITSLEAEATAMLCPMGWVQAMQARRGSAGHHHSWVQGQ